VTRFLAPLDRWLDRSAGRLAEIDLQSRVEQVGRVETVADGVAMVSGLPGLRLHELVRFESGQLGFALTLDDDMAGCVLLDPADGIRAGQRVSGSGEVVRVPVGEDLLGRVVDPLGRPLDDGVLPVGERQPIERPAPAIIDRALISEPLQTGILAIDAMFPLGRGQRELILGDRGTGKTAIGLDCMINQRDSDVICVYVAIGQKSSGIRQVIDSLASYGRFDRCIVVASPAADPPGLQWIAPFAAMTMAEYFRDSGRHALVVIDDLSKHAATHRELALLTRQPPGREAYPGDIFYLHSRLLERAAKLSPDLGGGSLTALPIAETDAGNLSAFIPTNLISITDGQIMLDARLFHDGQKPAIDIGRSVSRVGGKAQAPVLRRAAESLRLEYAQFIELEIFTRLGGGSDARIAAQMARGTRIRQLLQQPQYVPLPLAGEIALLHALRQGLLDTLSPSQVIAFRQGIGAWVNGAAAGIAAGGAAGEAQLDALLRAALAALPGESGAA
jgi:F-type H+-transporting ATPase subunit alpha